MKMISVTILTKNSSETLAATLDSCKRFSEVLVYDTGSSDGTKEIARRYPNVRVVEGSFSGFGPTHNSASEAALHDWILSIDSDEVISSELAEEILALTLDERRVYSLNRCNYFRGKWIRCCSGWYPDPVVRLYHRKQSRFTDDAVHEKVIAKGMKLVALKGPLLHTPYSSIDSFLSKMQTYSTLFAEQHAGKRRSSLPRALAHSVWAFLKNYLFKRGFLGGREGFIISLYNAQTTYYKYLKLAWRNRSW